jgi:hypothetical protein
MKVDEKVKIMKVIKLSRSYHAPGLTPFTTRFYKVFLLYPPNS